MGIDRVVANDPRDRTSIEPECRRIEPGEQGRPSHQCAPGKGEPKRNLRPVGDAFHERIDRDDRKGSKADAAREAVELQQHGEPDQGLQHEKGRCHRYCHLSRWYRSRAGALDPLVKVAIYDVIPGATSAAHGEGTDEKQKHMLDIDLPAGVDGGQSNGPPTRYQQQPGADRPVETGEPKVGAQPSGGDAVDPITGRIGDAVRAVGHRASGLPIKVSKVPCPREADASGTVGVVPNASLRVGPLGCGPRAAASQMFLAVSDALLCPNLTCLIASAGTLQGVLFSSSTLTNFVSAAMNALNSLQISSADAFFLPAACNACPCLAVSSREVNICWQAGGGPCCGAPNPAPGIPGMPGAPGIPGAPGMPG